MALALAVLPAIDAGAEEPASKRRYTLFDPTPRAEMREMSTDRPDVTESPRTVDAGHVQVEMSFVDWVHDDAGGTTTDTVSVLPMNVKLGLLNDVEIQLIFTPYVHDRAADDEIADVADGFGDDTEVRVKVNLWGNDGPAPGFGDTAMGIMPYVKLPTGEGGLSNDHVEGGVIVPMAAELPAGIGLGLMGEVDAVYDDDCGGYGVGFLHSVAIGRDVPWIARLAGYVEYVGVAPHHTCAGYQSIASGGLTYAVSDDWVLDCGATFGLSADADDVTAFAGTSFRF